MFINVGGAVLGLAVLTVIRDSVTANHGGEGKPSALLAGFRAGYYGSMAMCVLGSGSSYRRSQRKSRRQNQQMRQEPTRLQTRLMKSGRIRLEVV